VLEFFTTSATAALSPMTAIYYNVIQMYLNAYDHVGVCAIGFVYNTALKTL